VFHNQPIKPYFLIS